MEVENLERKITIIDREGKERGITIGIQKYSEEEEDSPNVVNVCTKRCKLYKICNTMLTSPEKQYDTLFSWCFHLSDKDKETFYDDKYIFDLYPKDLMNEYPELFLKNLRPSWKKLK